MLPEKITISIISPFEDDSVYINSTLRNAGITVKSLWSDSTHDCLEDLKKDKLHLIFMRTKNFSGVDEKIIDQIKDIQKYIPVILIHDEVNQKTLTIALQMGAHDLVSMDYPDRLTILTCRELGSFLKARELYKLRDEVENYQEKLRTLKSEATLPTMIMIDGVIVESNPVADELFCKNENDHLHSNPILDYVHANDQTMLRGALKAANQDKFNNDELVIKFTSPKLGVLRMGCQFEFYEYDGENAVRMRLRQMPVSEISSGLSIQLDPLTRIYHRQKFIQAAQDSLNEPLESGIRALLYIKIDAFKDLQTEVGILEMDTVLQSFSDNILEAITNEDVYGRFGGSSFAILTQKGTMADVTSWAEHFQELLTQNPCLVNNEEHSLSCSIGIAEWQQENDSFLGLLQRARDSLKKAQNDGPGNISVNRYFEEITMRSKSYDIEWVARIKNALLQNRFQLFQFPISSLRMTSKNMIDVYLRMQDDDGELILPNVFMPTAERNNLAKSLDRWVIGASIRYCQQNNHAKMFVRLSKKSLLDEGLIEWCNKVVSDHEIKSDNLVFQLVEEDVFDLVPMLYERIQEYRQHGYGVAIEHFGKNPGHLKLLKELEVDYIKIDSTLIQGLTDSKDRQASVKALCEIAGEKQIATVAEQVETAETMAILYQLGADYMQGKFTLEPEVILGAE